MPSVKLDHAVVAVSDWSRSNAFYSDLSFEWPGPNGEAEAHLERHRVAVELDPCGASACAEWG